MSASQDILANAVNEVVKNNPHITDNVEDLVLKVSEEFIKQKIDDFPRMCDVARMQNKIKMDALRETASRGKFDLHFNTETYWSDEGSFMFDYDIPEDLYLFMVNFVYRKFWESGNEKVWRPFMKAICRRTSAMTKYEAENLLMKVKTLYGPNSDASLT